MLTNLFENMGRMTIFKTAIGSGKMKTKLLFVFTAIGLLVSDNVAADTVLYCQSELATGFIKENGAWKETNFRQQRYIIKFNKDYSRLEGLSSRSPMECSIRYRSKPNLVFCAGLIGSHRTFMYSKITKRFVFSYISSVGYVDNPNNPGTENMYAGTCQTF